MREPALSPTRVRQRRRARLLVVGLVWSTTWVATAVGAATDPADEIASTQAAIDELAERWFDAQSESTELHAQIEQLEGELEELQQAAERLRGDAKVQAVALYEGANSAVEADSLFGGGSAMDADRRNVLLGSINDAVRKDIDAHATAAAQARARLAELDAARTQLDTTIARLADDEVALRRQLARAQADYRARVAAEAAAKARAEAATNASDDTDGEPSPTEPNDPGPTQPDDPDDPDDPGDPDPDEPDPVDPPPPPAPGEHPRHNDPFLSCVRWRESRGDYSVVNWSGPWYGAYQFAASTWDATASHAGRPQLIGVLPNAASRWDQDDLAWVLYQWQGKGPWGGGCG